MYVSTFGVGTTDRPLRIKNYSSPEALRIFTFLIVLLYLAKIVFFVVIVLDHTVPWVLRGTWEIEK